MSYYDFAHWLNGFLDALGEVKRPNEAQWKKITWQFALANQGEFNCVSAYKLEPSLGDIATCSDH